MTGSRRNFYLYIAADESGTLYTGHLRDLHLAVTRHRTKESPGGHDPKRLVYYEVFSDRRAAQGRAREIKAWTRKRKLELISAVNPQLNDLTP